MPDSRRPTDEAARVTDAARFAVLPDAAETLLDELSRRFLVERREVKEPLEDGSSIRSVRLIPRTLVAAPLAVDFTDTPGVGLRLGRWFRQSLPGCGCDACGEQPDELVRQLHSRAAALVEGGLWERVRRGVAGSWAEARLIGPGFRVGQQVPLDARAAREARREGFAAAVQWGPWPARP
jgi:hypothetical protein